MKYKRCCACDYFVTASDARCPNCGIADPRSDRDPRAETLALEPTMTDGTRAAFGGVIGAIIGGFLMAGMGVAVGMAVGVSLGVLLGADRDWSGPELPSLRRSVDSLKHIEELIQQRLAELTDREKRLNETRSMVAEQEALPVSESGERPWERVRARIDAAAATLGRQRERYHAKLWEIALVRWQNRLDPLAADWDTLTHDECAGRLQRLDEVQAEGKKYLEQWEGVDLVELPEAQRCLDRLRAALQSCDQLREQLIVQQATLAIKGIAPADDALDAHLNGPNLTALDAFNARAALGEFSSAFDDLESEFARLKSEEELAEKADIVRRLGRS